MKNALWITFGTLLSASLIAIASLYVQVQVLEVELGYLNGYVDRLYHQLEILQN